MRAAVSCLTAAVLCSCGPGAAVVAPSPAPGHPITHVVIIVQENRSLNNLFEGFPGATTVKYGYDSHGRKVTIKPVSLKTRWDILHDLGEFIAACNGTGKLPGTDCRMNGFDKEYWGCGNACPNADPPYSYVPREQIRPYWYLGRQYVLADQMYASDIDASSFVSHQYIIAGQARASVDYPASTWGCSGGPNDTVATITTYRGYGNRIPLCWNEQTIGQELDAAGLSWAYYASAVNRRDQSGIWSAYQNIAPIYNGPDWKNDIISPQTTFFDDVANGKLRAVTWITPTFTNSDHAGSNSDTGPAWVATLVNAIGRSHYWKNTAIFIFWDDYGGWYDPAAPKHLDYDGLGFRLPLLIVSPYAKPGFVDHTQYEHGSILKFIEETFGLAPLGASDTRASAPDAAFDFTQAPRPFTAVPSDRGIEFFKRQPPDHRAPDGD